MHIFLTYSFLDSLKRDGVTSKNVKLIGHGFLSLTDNLFWFLPFASSKQAHGIRETAVPAVTEENWAEMYAAITAEHDEEGAREQWAAGWKKWLAQQNPAAAVGRGGWRRRAWFRIFGRSGSPFRGGVSRGGPSAAVEAAAAAGRGGRWLGRAGRRAGQVGDQGSPYPGKYA